MKDQGLTAMTAEAQVIKTCAIYKARSEAITAIQNLVVRQTLSGKPAGISIKGCSGSGKTNIVEEIEELYEPRDDGEKIVREVVCISVPSKLSGGSVYRELVDKMKSYAPKNATLAELHRIASRLLHQCETKVIVLDEAQHLVANGKLEVISEVADALKSLMNSSKVSIALCGLKQLEDLFKTNEQLRRRFSETVTLDAWNVDDPDDFSEFVSVLMLFVANARLPKQKWYADMDTLKRIHFASNGTIAHMAKLMSGAVYNTVHAKRKQISTRDLEAAFIRLIWRDASGLRNPFSTRFDWNPLTNVNEPFAEGLV